MFKGTNLIQGENIPVPREYDYFYFEYPSDTKGKQYDKTEKTESGGRAKVQVNGKDWQGLKPADKPTALEYYEALPEDKREEYEGKLYEEAFATCTELAERLKFTKYPKLLLLEFATLGADRMQRIKLTPKKPKDIESILQGLEKDYRAAGMSEKKIKKMIEQQRATLQEEDNEEVAA